MIADGLGRAVAFILAPGQAGGAAPCGPAPGAPARRAEVGGGGPRLEQSRLPRARLELGCASGDPVQEERSPGGLSGVGATTIATTWERLWARLKEWHAIATRYEKTASSFMGVLCLAAALDWLKP